MSEVELTAAVEMLSDESHDPQGELLQQLERFYEGAPQPVRGHILGLARSGETGAGSGSSR